MKPMSSLVILLVALSMLWASSSASRCGGNCPGGHCDTCYCGWNSNYLSRAQVASWCASYSGWSQSCCRCIVAAESGLSQRRADGDKRRLTSGGNSNAMNENSNGSADVGLWQINSSNWGSCSGGSAPCSVSSNFNCAKKIHRWGRNTWKFWSTCRKCGCCGSA